MRGSSVKRIRATLLALLISALSLSAPTPSFSALTPAQQLDACIAAINDPLYTRSTMPGLMGLADAAAIEAKISNSTLIVWVANGAGVITGSGSANGNGQDLFCGDGNDNQVATMDSDASSQDYFFGGAGNDSVTNHMWFSTVYGGPGNDYVAYVDERSHFYGGPGTDSYGTLSADSFFEQGVDADTTPPTFPSADTFSVPENSTAVGTITTDESATITIDSGEDKLKFSLTRLTTTSASLAFTVAPDFEIPTDVGANNSYVVVFKGVDTSNNAGYETVTVTVTDVVDTSSFSGFSIAGNVTSAPYRIPISLSATVTVASKVTFLLNGKRISGCISKLATGSGSSYSVTCSWKPTQIGYMTIISQAVPTTAGISASTSSILRIFVPKRTTTR
ncbi:hypothetical protein MCEMRE182_00181 [Candidatus Nanopelagicaceae bacterium]